VKRFEYALDPALMAARADESSAAGVLVAATREAEMAAASVVLVASHVVALAANAVAHERELGQAPSQPACGGVRFLDRERCLNVLRVRETRAREAAHAAAQAWDDVRLAYESCVRRRRAFETHRERALEGYRRLVELAEAADFDEANAAACEAGGRWPGMDRA